MKKALTILTAVLFPAAIALILTASCGEPERRAGSPAIEDLEDMGESPWVLDIEEATVDNDYYRIARWTGEYMQMVLMSLRPGEIIDLEVHEDHDQFIRIEQGEARVLMGESEDNLYFDETVSDDWAIFIPAGYWHQVINTGNNDLKLYTIYAPSEHPAGIIHETYEEAEEYSHEHEH